MAGENCFNCVYAYYDVAQVVMSFTCPFPTRPTCAIIRIRSAMPGRRPYERSAGTTDPNPPIRPRAPNESRWTTGSTPRWTPRITNGSASTIGVCRTATRPGGRRPGWSTCTVS